MKNADMPASPTDLVIADYKGTVNCPYNKPLTGLTKREAFAMAAMQGILASKYVSDYIADGKDISGHNVSCKPVEAVAHISMSYADALLKELDK